MNKLFDRCPSFKVFPMLKKFGGIRLIFYSLILAVTQCLFYSSTAYAVINSNSEIYQKVIRGIVTDQTGLPLPGVTVLVDGTTRGTVTDVNGEYTLTDVPDGARLLFSFVGMQTQIVEIGNQTMININMQEETVALDEVVAIGYGTQMKRDVSSAISSVSSEALADRPVSSFTRAISGQLSGVRVLNSNNAPGGGTNIIIRGVSSINATNDPLIVIDGFPLKDGFDQYENPLNAINPADIESIEVLKDASSGAIYGTQAANGVILITTKKGATGKPTINLNISTGLESIMHSMNPLNREDFLQFMDDARAQSYIVEDPNFGTNDPNAPQWSWDDDDATRIYNWTYNSVSYVGVINELYLRWIHVTPETKAQPYDTDWMDLSTHVGQVHDVQLSATGGTNDLKYMISGGYYNQDGIEDAGGYERFSFRANVDLQINKWLKTGLLLSPTLENLSVLASMESTFYDIVRIPPIYAAYDEEGEINYIGNTAGDWRQWNLSGFVNPLARSRADDQRRTARNLATIFGEINFTKDLAFRTEFHNEFRNRERNYFLPSSYPTTSGSPTRSYGLNDIDTRLYWNSQSFLTYKKLFGEHSVNALLGYSVEETSYKSTYVQKYDYPTDLVPTLNQAITILDAQNHARTNKSSESMIGMYGRIMYNYGGKYYLTASIRRDGSSKFGPDKKWGIFPSFSLAWRISDESFFTPLNKYINDLKIRGGWGVIGNAGIGNYQALSTLGSSPYIFTPGSTVAAGYVNGKISNSNLGWEATTDYGIGADMEFLENRIALSVDYFYRLTEDMLFSMPLPRITGFSSYMVNIGSMRNRGFEYELMTHNLTGTFKWTTTANLSYYRNRVLDTGEDKRPLISNNSYTIENKPLAGLYGYVFLGPYKDWEDVKTSPIKNPEQPLWLYRSCPGTAKLADVNGDGKIDTADQTILGSPNPDFIWSMTNNFEYKGFDLSIQVNGVQGGKKMMTQMEAVMARNNGTQNTIYEYFDNYWRPDRTDAKYATPSRKSWDGTSNRGTLVFDGTYINIQNISLGYTLPRNITSRVNVGQMRLYANIQNAFLITDYPGFNPEVNAAGSSALSQGIDAGAYPLTRIISFGVNLSL